MECNMGSSILCKSCLFSSILLLLVAESHSQGIVSRATYYKSSDGFGTPTGACGYGEYGRKINGGRVTGVSKLYRNGAGCGACYQVKCKVPLYCSEDGTTVVVTDHGEGAHIADFVLSQNAFAEMALPDMASKLFSYGVIGVEYNRIPCLYDADLLLKVHETSKYPVYLAVLLLFLPGADDITAFQVWQEESNEWKPMHRAYGAVYDTTNPPLGALTLRFLVTVSADYNYWVQLANVLPTDWEAGLTYNTGISS